LAKQEVDVLALMTKTDDKVQAFLMQPAGYQFNALSNPVASIRVSPG